MSDLIERISKVKEKVEKAREEESRLGGAMEEILNRLKKEHGVSSLKEAEKEMVKLEKEAKKLEGELETMVSDLEERIGETS